MNLFKKIKSFFKSLSKRFKTFRTKLQVKANYASDMHYNVQKEREITCILNGHTWDHVFDPSSVDGRKLAERTFCKVCGVKFHKHTYRKV
jgi:hypothetical protein